MDNPSNDLPEEEAKKERDRLFGILEDLVKWENSNDENVLGRARVEIMRSTGGNPPPVLDPFCGGGSIPLKAQRLGLEAHGSDLNPVAVLITKALIEVVPPLVVGRVAYLQRRGERWATNWFPPALPFCPNRRCEAHGKVSEGIIIIKFARITTGVQSATNASSVGAPSHGYQGHFVLPSPRTPRKEILQTLALLAEGVPMSTIARTKGIKADTILAWLREAALLIAGESRTCCSL